MNHLLKLPHNKLLTQFLLLVAAWGTFGNTLLNGFVWDDTTYTADNPVYARFDIYRIFATLANGVEYLPVRDLSYAADHHFWGHNPAGFHASNVLYYWFTVMAVYFLARTTYKLLLGHEIDDADKRASFTGLATALLFAVHPIHSEVVSFISCRNAILSTLFFVLACCFYLRFIRAPDAAAERFFNYGGALVCFCASLLSKATGIILPLVLSLYVLTFYGRLRMKSVLPLLPFFVVSVAAFFLFTEIASDAHIITASAGIWSLGRLTGQVVKAVQIAGFYLWKMFVPYGFSAEYDVFFGQSPTMSGFVIVLVGLLLVIVMGIWMRKSRPYILFSLSWYLLTLIPVLNFLPTFPVIADRYAFLPSFAIFFLLASAGVELLSKTRPVWVLCCTVIVIFVWSGITIARNRVWYSDETLWKDTIRASPGSAKAYTNLGRVYFAADYNDERAFTLFGQARQINPADPTYDYFTGYRCYLLQDIPEAIQHLNKALGRDIEFIEALYLLGIIYETSGEKEKAGEYFRLLIQSREPDVGSFKLEAAKHLQNLRRDTIK